MSIQYTGCWDSNPQPSEHEYLPITNRPGLLPDNSYSTLKLGVDPGLYIKADSTNNCR